MKADDIEIPLNTKNGRCCPHNYPVKGFVRVYV
jgi:hypothetical protein